MRFFNPVNVYIEKNCVKNHAAELTSYGKKAYIITGRHSAKANGSLDDVISVLEAGDISYAVYSDIEENPSVETVWKAAQIGKEEEVDFVIGIGGGSPLDASKAIALLIKNPEETTECLYQAKELETLPVIAIPTTCGTGSEVTAISVLTRHDTQTKQSIPYKIFPKLALVDGTYLSFASKKIIINTSIDALAHCVESYLNASANAYNRMFSEYGLKSWAKTKEVLLADSTPDIETCEQLMLTSTIAGMAISHTGTSIPHAMSYEITYNKHVAHGPACGAFLSAYMKEYASHNEKDVKDILTLLEFESLDDFDTYLKKLIVPAKVTAEEIEQYASSLMANKGKLATFPYELTKEAVLNIYKTSLL